MGSRANWMLDAISWLRSGLWPPRRTRTGLALLVLGVSLLAPATSGATTQNSTTVAVSPDGTRVYAGFNGVGFSVFSRDTSTGELTVLGEAPGAPTGGGLFNPSIALSPDGANVYGVDGQGNALLQYAPAPGGVVSQQSYPVLADTTVAKDPITLALSPDGASVYALTYGVQYGSGVGVNSDGKITAFRRDAATGNLSLVGTAVPLDTSSNFGGAVGNDPVVSPDGKFVYVSSPSASGGVYVLSRDTTTGAVAFFARDGSLSSGNALAVSADGNFVYETGAPSSSSSASSAISVLARDPTGHLTEKSRIQNGVNGVSGLSDMWGVALSPDGHCVYATSRADGSLGYLTRDPSTGALAFGGVVTEGEGGVAGLANGREVTVSPDGKDVYVASPDDHGVAVFARNSTTCAPSFLQLVQDLFTLGQPSLNPTLGTATLPVNVDTSGTLDASVAPVTPQPSARAAAADRRVIPVGTAGVVTVPIQLDPQATQELDARHKLTVKATLTFTASGGTPTTKTTLIQLVKAPSPAVSSLGVSPSRFSLVGRRVKGHCVIPTKKNKASRRCRRPIKLRVSYRLNASAAVTFTVKLQAPGRMVSGRCVKPTRKNRRRRRCTRLLNVPGKLVQSGKAGNNKLTFNGQIGGHRLGPGTYDVIATPTGGTPKSATFKILP